MSVHGYRYRHIAIVLGLTLLLSLALVAMVMAANPAASLDAGYLAFPNESGLRISEIESNSTFTDQDVQDNRRSAR